MWVVWSFAVLLLLIIIIIMCRYFCWSRLHSPGEWVPLQGRKGGSLGERTVGHCLRWFLGPSRCKSGLSSAGIQYVRCVQFCRDDPNILLMSCPITLIAILGLFLHNQYRRHHLFLNRQGRWGTTDNFATSFIHFSQFSTALWDLTNSRTVHSLMLSSHLLLCLPCLLPHFTVPCKAHS